jgi:hypothetical protein
MADRRPFKRYHPIPDVSVRVAKVEDKLFRIGNLVECRQYGNVFMISSIDEDSNNRFMDLIVLGVSGGGLEACDIGKTRKVCHPRGYDLFNGELVLSQVSG